MRKPSQTIVWDGSSDHVGSVILCTYQIMQPSWAGTSGGPCSIHMRRKPNGGSSVRHSSGIRRSSGQWPCNACGACRGGSDYFGVLDLALFVRSDTNLVQLTADSRIYRAYHPVEPGVPLISSARKRS